MALVVQWLEYLPSKQVARVRFPDDAPFLRDSHGVGGWVGEAWKTYMLWGISSIGRVRRSQRRGTGIETRILHFWCQHDVCGATGLEVAGYESHSKFGHCGLVCTFPSAAFHQSKLPGGKYIAVKMVIFERV